MANRSFQDVQFNSDCGVVRLFVAVAFNGSSAPSLLVCNLANGNYTVAPSAGNGVAKSFTRASTGNYTLTLKDTFVRLLGYNIAFLGSANAAAPLAQIKVASDPTNGQAFGTNVACGTVRTGTPSVNILTFSSQGTAADPAATEIALIEIELQNSTAGSGTS